MVRPDKGPTHIPPPNRSEPMWSLDVSLVALASLVLYLVVTQLRFDDPRWLYNGWTYAVAVPLVALGLALLLREVASQYVQKSIQVGFLFSICLHLLLLILAVNVVIFKHYFPDAIAGVKPERSPVRRTVPEYLFQTPEETAETPDWSEPVDAETASRVVPEEQRQLPPVEHTAPRLEMPNPREPQPRPMQKFLMRREQPAETQPQPADSPARAARRRTPREEPNQQNMESPRAPTVPTQATARADTANAERQIDTQLSRSASRRTSNPTNMSSAAPADLPMKSEQMPLASARARSDAQPMIGESGLTRQRQHRSRSERVQPAGAAPAPQTVATARLDDASDRMVARQQVPLERTSQTTGAQLASGNTPSPSLPVTSQESQEGGEFSRSDLAARAGMPNVSAGDSPRAPGRAQRRSTGAGFAPAGTPDASQAVAASTGTESGGASEEIADRIGSSQLMSDRAAGSGANAPAMSEASASGPTLDFLLDDGPTGLANSISPNAGVVPSMERPEIASFELSRDSRPRRAVGGPATPVGTKIAAVESFSRRVMRTEGGAAPTPAGVVGPATEEAIERGLAYLASIQNEDGSWSLQGHGREVALQSDAAATGLCLLAFQGAGYTHLQHQYAETVGKGLQFLIENQRTNGDLYRRENQLSDRNVALYSHGIACLAMCEAYGMTQDADLQGPAQSALNFVVASQHRQRGGWRYTPQVSSDTSVTGWMMMSLKSGELAGLEVPQKSYEGIEHWLELAQQSEDRQDRYRYNPFAPNTPTQRHGRYATPTMTAVGMLMRMYLGWRRENEAMQSAADYLLEHAPEMGTLRSPKRDTYYWYYATMVMFHMGGEHWERWNHYLNPLMLQDQITDGPNAGSWDPETPVPDRWSPHAGRLYVTTMNLLNLEVYYRHLPIYEETAN